MSFVKVTGNYGSNRLAEGIYEFESGSGTWLQVTPNNAYVFEFVTSAWNLQDGDDVLVETGVGGNSLTPESATWVDYVVTEIISPGDIPDAAGTPLTPGQLPSTIGGGVVTTSPGSIDPQSAGVPASPGYAGSIAPRVSGLFQGPGLPVVTVANEAERLALTRTIAGLTRVIQSDDPSLIWLLIDYDPTNTASWAGIPYADPVDRKILVTLELVDQTGLVPADGILGRVGDNLSLGDGVTTGGLIIPPPLLLAADPVNTAFATVTGTLTSDGVTPITTPVVLPKIAEDSYTDGATLVLTNGGNQWDLNDSGSAQWLSEIGDDLETATWTAQGTNTGTPVVTLTEATVGVPGQHAIIDDGGVFILNAAGTWIELN